MSVDIGKCVRYGCEAPAMRLISTGDGKGEWLCYPHADAKVELIKEQRGKAR